MVEIIQREQWGARYDDGGGDAAIPYDDIVIHHSVTLAPDLVAPFDDDYAAVRQLDAIGEARFGRGNSYTWPITPVGLVFEGHSVHRLGTHTGGYNTSKRAICFVGDYSTNPPTAAQVNAAAEVVRQEHAAGRCKSPTVRYGHRDLKATGCPGNAGYEAIKRINTVIESGVAAGPTIVVPPVKPPHAPAPHADFLPFDFPLPAGHWFGKPSRDPKNHSGFYGGEDNHNVRVLQEGLRKRGWRVSTDGKYGDQTRGVVVAFQREKGLAVDGLTGIATWSAIDRSPVT